MAAPLRVVLDANVLFPAVLRDTLLRAAERGLYRIFWSDRLLDEMCRNLIATQRAASEKVERLRAAMERAFPEAMVSGYEPLIAQVANAPRDRHVAALAVKVKADAIVTANLRDFRRLPNRMQALSPDDFLCRLFASNRDAWAGLLREQADDLHNPPQSLDDLLSGLQKFAPRFVHLVQTLLK